VPVRATLRQDCDGSRESGQASDQANARRPGRCRQRGRTSPIQGTGSRAVQFLGHALATATSLRSLRQEPVDATLTVSARGTSSHQLSEVDLTVRQAHDLDVRLEALETRVLTCRRLGHSLTDPILEAVDHH
jgi:hypothetical protein